MADYSGFPENETDKVFIILDKMDKIGLDGVREELLAEGYAPEAVSYTHLDVYKRQRVFRRRAGLIMWQTIRMLQR